MENVIETFEDAYENNYFQNINKILNDHEIILEKRKLLQCLFPNMASLRNQ